MNLPTAGFGYDDRGEDPRPLPTIEQWDDDLIAEAWFHVDTTRATHDDWSDAYVAHGQIGGRDLTSDEINALTPEQERAIVANYMNNRYP